jgi:hypothetical protein
VDSSGNRLLRSHPASGYVAAVGSASATPDSTDTRDTWQTLLQEFPGLSAEMSTSTRPAHGVLHHIETTGRPVTAKFRRLCPERLDAAKEEFSRMLKAGIIRRSHSQWSSPLHLVKKKDGSWRPCGDFRHLNLITVTDKYPLPNMADFSARLDGCTVFSKLDLNKGYLQVPVTTADVPKTALITPFGLFEFIHMPLGLKNAGMTFQRMMDHIFADLPYVFIYLDDVLIATRSAADHRKHLRQVFQLLSDNGLLLNVQMCVLAASSIDFLGHRITANGIQPLPGRVEAINTFPSPHTIKDLGSPALRVLDVKINGADVKVDVSSGVFRPLVPWSFRQHIFNAIHGLAHPGIRATRHLIASRYVWPQLAANVKNWCNECQQCQAADGGDTEHRHTDHTLHPRSLGPRGASSSCRR